MHMSYIYNAEIFQAHISKPTFTLNEHIALYVSQTYSLEYSPDSKHHFTLFCTEKENICVRPEKRILH